MLLCVDTETTGLNNFHGCKPFFVSTCNKEGEQTYWEWEVNPFDRRPMIPREDVEEIAALVLDSGAELVLQNGKFDVHALATLHPNFGTSWPWDRMQDTIIAGHLLRSDRAHDLTTLVLDYLEYDISRHEGALKAAAKEARREARKVDFIREYGEWRLADKGLPELPSATQELWKNDLWLPRAVARTLGYPDDHPWHTVLRDYANMDTASTLALWLKQKQLLQENDLWEIYRERMKAVPVAYAMEHQGVTVNGVALDELTDTYREESVRNRERCENIASTFGHELTLPKAGVNNNLRTFLFDHLRLPKVKGHKARTNNPSLTKGVMQGYLETTRKGGKAHTFIRSLLDKRTRDTAIQYMEGYRRFWLPLLEGDVEVPDWYVLHPSLNITGTATLRWSSSNPNEQNISKREGFNLRYAFGPAPGRIWVSCDAQNIELRLPAYEAGEQAMIDLFERPDDPPYYGSNHLLAAHIIHPEKFEACLDERGQVDGRLFKKNHPTLYSWTKNGNFAVQYGAQEESGTADRAYGVRGAQAKIQSRLGKIADLNRRMIAHAEERGYVETIPDRTVNPRRGYPVWCGTSGYGGKVKPTIPLSYHIQSTAMQWMAKSMVRCHAQLEAWRQKDGYDGRIVMQVHDELVFDLPRPKVHPLDGKNSDDMAVRAASDLWRIRKLQALMEEGGRDIGIPTPTSCEVHDVNWSEGLKL